MEQKQLNGVLSVLALVVLIGGSIWAYETWKKPKIYKVPAPMYVSTSDKGTTTVAINSTFKPDISTSSPLIFHRSVDKDGTVVYKGELTAPECDTVSTRVSTYGEKPVQMSVMFLVLTPPTCAGNGTAKTFMFAQKPPKGQPAPELSFVAVNGQKVQYKVVDTK